jgi:hypothetical protein
MVVVDQGKRAIGRTIEVTVTSVLQTTAGKMIFCKWPEALLAPAEPEGRRDGRGEGRRDERREGREGREGRNGRDHRRDERAPAAPGEAARPAETAGDGHAAPGSGAPPRGE